MNRNKVSVSLLALLAGGAISPTTAWAQAAVPAGTSEATVGEIVVTAQRRAESIQKTPVAVTAINTEKLREQSIATAQDLLGKVPSVVISPNGSQRSAEAITIRGQGQTFGASAGVVNYFAEVPLLQGSVIGNQGGPGTFLDLESLQVLRGPQGTLFGRNTTGGALLLGPKKPTNEFEGYVQAQFGNYADREFEGVINLPVIADKLMIRIAGKKVDRDGFTTDVGPQPFGFTNVCLASAAGCLPSGQRSAGFAGKDYDDRHYWTGRIGVLFKPADGIENYLVAYYTKSHDNGSGIVLSGANATSRNLADLAANLAYRRPFLPALSFDPTIMQGVFAEQQQLGPRKVAYNTDQFSRLEMFSIVDTLSAEVNDSLTLRNIIGYQRMKQSFAWDLDGTIVPVLAQLPAVVPAGYPQVGPSGATALMTNLSLLTEEPQLQGKLFEDKLNFVVGGFYAHTRPQGPQATGTFNVGALGANFFDINTRSYAAYAQATIDLGLLAPSLTGLKLTGGFRKTWDRIDGSRVAPNFVVIPVASAKLDSSAPTWTVGVDYQASRNVFLFGKVTRGYKSGGFNSLGPEQSVLTFKPEYVTSYEIGAKTDFRVADVPVRLNVSAYNLDYKDIQRATADSAPNGLPPPASGVDSGSRVFNAESARIRGVEVEAVVRPARNFELSANYAYTDARYKKYILDVAADPRIRFKDSCSGPVAIPSAPGTSVALDLSCIPFPYAPKNQFNVNARYSAALGDTTGALVAVLNYAWVGSQSTAPISTPRDEPGSTLASYGLLNASLEWNGIFGSQIDARLFMTNVTNKTYRISSTSASSAGLGFSASIYGEPRMFGGSLRYRF